MTALPTQAAQWPAAAAEELEAAIRFARSEAELDTLVEELQGGFEAGHLSYAQADQLTYMLIDVARQLARGAANMPAGEQ
jgi:hypothetical protein